MDLSEIDLVNKRDGNSEYYESDDYNDKGSQCMDEYPLDLGGPLSSLRHDAVNSFDGIREWLDSSRTPASEYFGYASDHKLLQSPFLNPAQRMELPIVIRGTQIASRPDTGSEENIILSALVDQWGLAVDRREECQRTFRVANGKTMKALGRIKIDFYCTRDLAEGLSYSYMFYVFEFLVSPVIMGMAFLESTETLTKHRYRLQPRNSIPANVWQLCSVDYPRRKLYCLANDQPEFATADTGSELDLISSAFARDRGFVVEEIELSTSWVQFADGSMSQLRGRVTVSIVLGCGEDPPHVRDFYILDGLTSDLLLGEDFLDQVAAFTAYQDAFAVDIADDGIGEINTIVLLNPFQSGIASGLSRLFGQGAPMYESNDEVSSAARTGSNGEAFVISGQ